MSGALRLAWRVGALAALCAGGAVAIVTSNVFFALLRRSPRRARLRLFRFWSRAMLRLLGARVATVGVPPHPPFFLVSNHLGYVDVALLAAHAEAVFVAREDVSRWPVFGWLRRAVGTLYVDREMKRDLPRVAGAMEKVLEDGIGIVLFPEGTSTGGPEPLPFRPGASRLAASRFFGKHLGDELVGHLGGVHRVGALLDGGPRRLRIELADPELLHRQGTLRMVLL